MIRNFTYSASIVADLAREIYSLRLRCTSIIKSSLSCNNKRLIVRLNDELFSLESRRQEINQIASSISKAKLDEDISITFLLEVSSRPVYKAFA